MILNLRSILKVVFLGTVISLNSYPAEGFTYKERINQFEPVEWGIFPKKDLGNFTITD